MYIFLAFIFLDDFWVYWICGLVSDLDLGELSELLFQIFLLFLSFPSGILIMQVTLFEIVP